MGEKTPPLHPGEMFRDDFMVPLGLNANQLALKLNVPPGRIGKIIKGQRAITPDTARRLGRYFGQSAQFWNPKGVKVEIVLRHEPKLLIVDMAIKASIHTV